jgi:hypothetical protein
MKLADTVVEADPTWASAVVGRQVLHLQNDPMPDSREVFRHVWSEVQARPPRPGCDRSHEVEFHFDREQRSGRRFIMQISATSYNFTG